MTTDTRLGTLEGRADEQTAAIADLREGQREIRDALVALNRRFDEVQNTMNRRIDEARDTMNRRFVDTNRRIDETNMRIYDTNKRIDRVFFAMMGMGAAQIAMFITLATLIVRA